jgi:hypothetical protein
MHSIKNISERNKIGTQSRADAYIRRKRLISKSDYNLKVPMREIFDRSDFPDFYTIKSSWIGDLLVKILTYYFNF